MNCIANSSHHYIIDDDNKGICKKCGLEREFNFEINLPVREARKFWEISLDKLKDQEYDLLWESEIEE